MADRVEECSPVQEEM